MGLLFATRRALLGGGGIAQLHLTATTTGAQTVTINRLTPTGADITISWGDGNRETISDGETGTILHNYAGAGTWSIEVSNAKIITALDLRDSKLGGLDTAELVGSVLAYFYCTGITGSTIRSADMASWTPSTWRLYSMPAGTYSIDSADMASWTPFSWWLYSMPAGTYAIDSSDMASWTPTYWRLSGMPAGTYAIDSSDMASWTPEYWRLYSMPAADSSYTFAASCMRGWTRAREIRADGLGLAEAVVGTILADIYAGRAGYTYATPTLNVGDTNDAPSGVYQDGDPPTTGLEYVYELANDPETEGFNTWSITYTGGTAP